MNNSLFFCLNGFRIPIKPREYEGTSDFENLTPVLRSDHKKYFNSWWAAY